LKLVLENRTLQTNNNRTKNLPINNQRYFLYWMALCLGFRQIKQLIISEQNQAVPVPLTWLIVVPQTPRRKSYYITMSKDHFPVGLRENQLTTNPIPKRHHKTQRGNIHNPFLKSNLSL